MWLYIEDVSESVTKQDVEEKLQDISLLIGTSMHEEIRMIPLLKQVYIQYPSQQVASRVLHYIKGKIKLREKYYKTDFYSPGHKTAQAPAYADQGQDWACDKCDYKNFAKRTKCHKCDRPRSSACKLLAANQGAGQKALGHQPFYPSTSAQQFSENTSLMVRGPVITTVTETQLHEIFGKMTAIKDIRLIRSKTNGQQRDFAFVEFYTQEEAESVLQQCQSPAFNILGETVAVYFSRNRRPGEDAPGANS